ncbi:hypothetical protein OSTOST_10412, partial [Ostertagia ostertagi]
MVSLFGLLFVIFLVPTWSNAYKMVLFVPDMANSQVLFNARVAETLAKAGNDVTMVMILPYNDRDSSDVKIMKEVKIHRINASFGLTREFLEEQQQKVIFKNKEFLEWLTAQKFDLAFSHIYDVCHIGLIHYAKIPSWIWLNSGNLMDFVAHHMGVPRIPSYN